MLHDLTEVFFSSRVTDFPGMALEFPAHHYPQLLFMLKFSGMGLDPPGSLSMYFSANLVRHFSFSVCICAVFVDLPRLLFTRFHPALWKHSNMPP